ncbi:MAG: peptidylprolyl isomerase [Magnetococcus sp. DMHC-6]
MDYLKATGVFRTTIYRLIEVEVIHNRAKEMGIAVDEEEKEGYFEERRRLMGLASAKDMDLYCRQNGIRWEDWKQMALVDLLRRKIRARVVSEEDVRSYFQQQKDNLKSLSLGRILCKDLQEAMSILEQLRTKKGDFSELARNCSLEDTSRVSGGHLGCFQRGMLGLALETELFSAPIGAVLGPFAHGAYWSIYKVEQIMLPEWNDAIRARITDRLFYQWIRHQVLTAKP